MTRQSIFLKDVIENNLQRRHVQIKHSGEMHEQKPLVCIWDHEGMPYMQLIVSAH